MRIENSKIDIVDIYEQMLFERASKGIRPVLYVSSNKDLECSMLMLLDEESQQLASGAQPPIARGVGHQVTTN